MTDSRLPTAAIRPSSTATAVASGSDGFTFNDTAGAYSSSNTASDLGMILGGVDANTINNMEASWSKSFTVTEAGTGTLTLDYRMIMSSEYESDEYGEIQIKIDGNLVTVGGVSVRPEIDAPGMVHEPSPLSVPADRIAPDGTPEIVTSAPPAAAVSTS